MEDDFFAGHFKLNVHIQENRSRQTSLISDPRQGIRNKPKVTVWMREDSLADNVYLEKTNAGEMRVVKQVRRDPEKLKRILSELRALGRLSKENGLFIQFFGWFESANYIHFAMEYCPLGDISHCFKDPLSEVATRSIGRQVIEGLTKLHEIKITHRDIKPKNILVQQTNPIWVKISDFGFSKHVIDGQSELLTRAGTDGYIAPEVYGLYEPDEDSSAYTSAVDIWSLGCLLHYILTKKTPFPDLGALKTYCSDEGRVFPEEALVEHHVGASGSRFIKRLLILSPKDRPELASINIMRQWKITGVSAVDESTSFHPEDPNKGIVNVNQEDNMDYHTLELWKCIKEDIDMARVNALLGQGASASKEHKGYTALHLVARFGSVEQLDMLLHYVGDVNLKTRAHGDTALHMATYQRDARKIQLLIDRGADVNVQDLDHNSILHLALTSGCDIDILKMLLRKDVSLTAENMLGQTPFHHAICLYQEEKARLLLSNGSNPNVRDLDGRTPLHSAVASDRIPLAFIRDLVDSGANVLTEDHGHRTPLHEAVRAGREDVIRFLAERTPGYNIPYPELQRPVQKVLPGGGILGWMGL